MLSQHRDPRQVRVFHVLNCELLGQLMAGDTNCNWFKGAISEVWVRLVEGIPVFVPGAMPGRAAIPFLHFELMPQATPAGSQRAGTEGLARCARNAKPMALGHLSPSIK